MSTWGRFKIVELPQTAVSWIQRRKYAQVTKEIMDAIGIKFETNDILVIPSSNCENIDVNESFKCAELLKRYVQCLREMGVDPLLIYKMPEDPNKIMVNKVSKESTLFFQHVQELYRLEEVRHNLGDNNFNNLANVVREFDKDFDRKFGNNSVFPLSNYPGISLIRFISYFRCILSRISHLIALFNTYGLETKLFPYFIEVFTISYFPSFTFHHDVMEKVGDTFLSLCVCVNVIKILYNHDLQYINTRYNWLISNDLFIAVADHFNFQDAIIGEIDVEKVPADCFEALTFLFYISGGYEKAYNFWHESLFAIDQKYFEKNPQISKAIEGIKVGAKEIKQEIGNNVPQFAIKYVSNLNPTFYDVFVKNSELSCRCKMIGAAFIKFAVSYYVYNHLTKGEDILLIERKVKKTSLEEIVPTFGFPNQKVFKIFLGGYFLTNGFQPIYEMFEKYFVQGFELFPEKKRHHHHRRKTITE